MYRNRQNTAFHTQFNVRGRNRADWAFGEAVMPTQEEISCGALKALVIEDDHAPRSSANRNSLHNSVV
jgi:hypothetical protein